MSHAAQARQVDTDAIIDQIANGAYQSHIAGKLGLKPQRLHEVISKHPGYKDAMMLRNMALLDNAQANIDDPASELARARDAFKAASWRASVECPQVWGRQDQLTIAGKVELDATNIVEASRRIAFALSLAAHTAVPPLPEPSRVLDHVPGNGTVSTEPE